MKPLLRKAAAALLGITFATLASVANVTVRWMHIEQNPEAAALLADAARKFEAANPGVKIEMQYMENDSYKKS